MQHNKFISILIAFTLVFSTSAVFAATTLTGDQALHILMEGNMGFAKNGDVENLKKNSSTKVRRALAAGQSPYAIVLTCSDSRLSPEILFDQGLGQIFVVRVAGNVVAPHELGSIEYAVEHLGVPLIVVLGHEKCGAVNSTYAVYPNPVEGNLGSLVESITPAVEKVVGSNPKPTDPVLQAAQVEECILENIKMVTESLEVKSPVIKEYVELHKLKIVKGKYDLDDGKVTLIH